MLFFNKFPYGQVAQQSRFTSTFIDRNFQMKYTAIMVVAACLGIGFTLAPVYYFTNENYEIFYELAYQHSPQLLNHLESEKVWINTILFSFVSGIIVFVTLLSFRMTGRIIAPLQVMRNHIKQLSRGHWYQSTVKTRDKDEFQDLIETYNYFFSSVQNSLRRDLDRLKKISVDPQNKDAFLAWQSLVEEKSAQLNQTAPTILPQPITLNSSKSEPAHGSRRVS